MQSVRLLICARVVRVALLLLIGASFVFARAASADTAEAKKIFTTRCMACHTFGKGVKVGPDLKGVTERRQRPWLLKFVRASSTVIASGDPIATDLLAQFNQLRMPDWTDLSEAQIGSILDWLAANGPDQQDPDARTADQVTPAEIEAGRQLFYGERAMSRGSIACASCHSIRDSSGKNGGSLAEDLTTVYSQYQDGAMTQFLKHPCFQRFPDSALPAFLTPEESFAIKGYLREAALNDPSKAQGAAPMVAKTVDSSAGTPPGGAGAAAARPASTGGRVTWVPSPTGPSSGAWRRLAIPELLFQVFPYIALAILILGLGIRHAIARRQPDAIGPASRAAWQLFRGAAAWRIGLAITFALHLVILCLPGAILRWDSSPMRLYLLEGSGFALGAVALVGLVQLIWRHVRAAAKAHVRLFSIADDVLLSLLLVAILSGLTVAILYRWGSLWAVGTVTPYLRSLGQGEPAAALIGQMPFLIRLHAFAWFAVLAVVPFTHAAAIFVAAGDRVAMAAARLIDALGRSGQRTLGKLSLARWLWPEEDLPEDDDRNVQEPS
jgi:nitrate reductase gamma subunit/mono/diheme cytochrome c family protein